MTAISAPKCICCFKQFITSSYSTATLLPCHSFSVQLNSSLPACPAFGLAAPCSANHNPQPLPTATPYLASLGKYKETENQELETRAPCKWYEQQKQEGKYRKRCIRQMEPLSAVFLQQSRSSPISISLKHSMNLSCTNRQQRPKEHLAFHSGA